MYRLKGDFGKKAGLMSVILLFLITFLLFFVLMVTAPDSLPAVNVSLFNGTSDDATLILKSGQLFFYANYSNNLSLTEENSTFKWLKRTLYQPQNRSLVGYWKLDGNANDSSSYGNGGTLMNGARSNDSMDCRIDGCLTFDGVNDFVNISDSASLDIAGQGTVELWYYLNTLGLAHNQFIFGKGDTAGNDASYNYRIVILDINAQYPDRIYAGIGNGVSSNSLVSSAASATDTWVHTALVWNSTHLNLYVNGVLDNSTAQTVTPAVNSFPLAFGDTYNGGTNGFEGNVDEVAVYNYAKSAAEIKADFDNSPYKAMIYKDAVLYLHLDENGNGVNYSDSSGSGNHGAPTGTANVSGRIRGAAKFDGVNDVITFGKTVTPVGAKTVNFWVNFANLSSAEGGAIIQYLYANQQGSGGKSGLYLRTNGADLSVLLQNGAGTIFFQTYSNVFTKDTWNFVSFAWDGTTSANAVRVRVNDQTFTGTSTGTETLAPSYNLALGTDPQTPAYTLNGTLDEVSVYNRSLTASEVKQLYLRTWYDHSPQLFLLQPYKDNATGLNSSDNEAPTAAVAAKNVTGAYAGTQGVNLTPNGYLNYSAAGNFNEKEGTIEFWVKPEWNGNDGISHVFVSAEKTNNNFIFYKQTQNDVRLIASGSTILKTDVSEWLAGDWHHVAATWNNYTSNTTLHVDGVQTNTSSTPFYIPLQSTLTIGRYQQGLTGFCNCTFSEFRISRKALTAQEINQSFSKSRQFYQNEYMLNNSNFVKGDVFRLEYTPKDSANYTGTLVNSSFITVQNSVPSIPVINTPTAGSYNTTSTITWSAVTDADGDAVTYRVYVNGTFNGSTTATKLALNMTSEKTYAINLSAFDGTDDSGNNTQVQFVFDNLNPRLDNGSNSINTSRFINVNHVMVNFTFTEPFNHTAYVRNGSGSITTNTTPIMNATYFRYNFTSLNDTNYTFSAWMNDSAGNVNTTTNISVVVDTTFPAPSYGSGSDANGTSFTRGYFSFNITVAELYNGTMNVSLVNGSFNVVQSINITYNTTPYFNNITFSGVANGTYNVSIVITDRAGNVNLSAANRTVRVDTTLPSISWVRPTAANIRTYYGTSTPQINTSCFDDNLFRCNLTLYFANNMTIHYGNLSNNINVSRYWHNLTLPSLGEGNYILEINATDDLTFSPPLKNFKGKAQNDNFISRINYADPDSGAEFNITIELLNPSPLNNTVSLNDYSISSRVIEKGSQLKLLTGINKTPPANMRFRYTFVPISKDATYRTPASGEPFHFVVGNKFWHAKDLLDSGYSISETSLDGSRVMIVTRTGGWSAAPFVLDPVAGGLNVLGEQTNITIDTVLPVITLTSPANNSIFSTATINFGFNVTDANTISLCLLYVSGENLFNYTPNSNVSTQSSTFSFGSGGSRGWYATCNDTAGNWANSTQFGFTSIISPGGDSPGVGDGARGSGLQVSPLASMRLLYSSYWQTGAYSDVAVTTYGEDSRLTDAMVRAILHDKSVSYQSMRTLQSGSYALTFFANGNAPEGLYNMTIEATKGSRVLSENITVSLLRSLTIEQKLKTEEKTANLSASNDEAETVVTSRMQGLTARTFAVVITILSIIFILAVSIYFILARGGGK